MSAYRHVLIIFMLLVSHAHADDTLHLYNWNNYISAETIARFEAQCRCKVVQDYYSDNEEMLAKLAAGASGYDIIVPPAMPWKHSSASMRCARWTRPACPISKISMPPIWIPLSTAATAIPCPMPTPSHC